MIVSTRDYVTWKNPLTDYFSRCNPCLILILPLVTLPLGGVPRNHAKTTEKGHSATRALSMNQGFRPGAPDSDDSAVEDDDEDLSYEGEQEEVKLMKVMKTPSPGTDETQALKETRKLIAELPLDPAVQSEQEATHLRILMAAAKAADISAEGSFVPPAIVTNLLKVTSALLGVVEASNDRQSQLGFQLDENVS